MPACKTRHFLDCEPVFRLSMQTTNTRTLPKVWKCSCKTKLTTSYLSLENIWKTQLSYLDTWDKKKRDLGFNGNISAKFKERWHEHYSSLRYRGVGLQQLETELDKLVGCSRETHWTFMASSTKIDRIEVRSVQLSGSSSLASKSMWSESIDDSIVLGLKAMTWLWD